MRAPLPLALATVLRGSVVSVAWRCRAALVLAAPLACRPAPDDVASQPPAPAPVSAVDAAPAPAPAVAIAPPPGATTITTGVAIHVLDPGEPDAPAPQWGDFVELRYRVWDESGRLVGASRDGRSERLALAWLPRGWADAMLELRVGSHAHVWVPAAQAYGEALAGPRGALRIDVHLLGVEPTGEVVAADVPLSTPPPNALRTASGIYFLVLREGTGTRHAARDGRVTVHYEGWTAADGNRFDSSYARGQPATFPLTAVIAGWQEAVTLMVEGEKTRFWIPAELAYGDAPGRPNGTLVFDIELVRIEE